MQPRIFAAALLTAGLALSAASPATAEPTLHRGDPYDLNRVAPVILEPGPAAEDDFGFYYDGRGRGYTYQPDLRSYGPRVLDQRRPLTSFFLDTQSTRLVDLRRTLNVRRANYFRHGFHGYQNPFPYIPPTGAVTVYRNPFFHNQAVTAAGEDATQEVNGRHYGNGTTPRPGVQSSAPADTVRAEEASPEADVVYLNPTHAGQIKVESGQVMIRGADGAAVLLSENN